jgi:septum formation inhibitor-activating ATPase MinD
MNDTVLLVSANPVNRMIRDTLVSKAKRDVIDVYQVLLEERSLSEAVLETDSDHLFVLASEYSKRQIGVFPALRRFANLLEDMRQNYHYVIIDLPEVSELTPCFDLAAELDGVLMEVEANRSRVRVAQRAVQQMTQAGINVLGCVLKEA